MWITRSSARSITALAFSLTLLAAPLQAAPGDLPADLDLVPRDAAAFFHFRAKDMWQSEWMKDARYILEKAGPEAWKEFERKCPINPTTIDRITLVMLTPREFDHPFSTVDPEALSALVVVRTTQPYDRLQLLQAAGTREKAYRRNIYHFHEDLWSGLVLVDDKTFLVGSEDAVVRWFDMAKTKNTAGPLQAALTEAAQKHHIVFGFNPTLLGKEAQGAPPPIQKLLEAHCGTVTLDLDKEIRLDLRLDYQKAEQAQAGEKAVRDTLELGRQGLAQPIGMLEKQLKDSGDKVENAVQNFAILFGLGFLREVDSLLKDAPVQRQGTTVTLPFRYRKLESANMAVVSLAGIQILGRNASAAFGQVGASIGGKDAKDPMQVHLETLHQAMEKYHADKGSYPPATLVDKDGRPTMSWRVALLPYINDEAKTLYNQFRLDEPWDSLHNKRLIKKMPPAFRSPNRYAWGASQWKTRDQVFTGAGTLFEGAKTTRKTDVTSKLILLVHTGDDRAVYWTKPADIAYVPDGPLPQLTGRYDNQFQVLLNDGSFRRIQVPMDEKDLRSLILRQKVDSAPSPAVPTAQQPDAVWNDWILHDEEGAKKARAGIRTLVASPQVAMPFLKERVKPVLPADAKHIEQSIANLDSSNFQAREQASKMLEAFGVLALPAIEKKLGGKPSLEVQQRLEGLREKINDQAMTAAELRGVRAIETLALIGTPEAKAVLQDLAKGGEGALLTEQAKLALARLNRAK
jgi:hypothetical protein